MLGLKDILRKAFAEKKNVALIICAIIALAFVLLSEAENVTDDNKNDGLKECVSSEDYIAKQEARLEEILRNIDGAGEVRVMITLESCYENVYLKESAVKTESNNEDYKKEEEETYIIAKTDSNKQEGVIIKVYEPVVKGVAVLAEGAENERVKMAILETVSAVFNINSTNISVEKMKYERNE